VICEFLFENSEWFLKDSRLCADIQDDQKVSVHLKIITQIITIIINIKDWTLSSVPSPKLQLLSPTFLGSSICSLSLWSAVV